MSRYIAIEGVDGAGTTTMSRLLVDHLSQTEPALLMAEPGHPKVAPMIRSLLKSEATPRVEAARALLFAADRLLRHDLFERMLGNGVTLISDRCYLSSLAYQPSEALPEAWVESLQRHILRPDVIVYLRVTPEVALSRMSGRIERDVYETEAAVRRHVERYDRLANAMASVVTVDANGSKEETLAGVVRAVEDSR